MINPNDFKRAIQVIDGLGATPAVLVKVAQLAQDPNSDLTTMAAFLRNDGPLAADIIRLSNSPYYAPSACHGNLSSALNQIGLREVVRVVNLSLARKLFARDLPGYGVTARDYWSESVAAALLMEALATLCSLDLEDAYTIGILHAIGRVLINRVIEDHGFSVYWDGLEPIQNWERTAVGFDFAEAGAMLLEHWNFPPASCDILRWQLEPDKALEPLSMLACLQFSQRLLALSGADFSNKNWAFPQSDPFVIAAGLTAESLGRLIGGCQENFQRILESVDLD